MVGQNLWIGGQQEYKKDAGQQYAVPEKNTRERDQEMFDQMHKEADAGEKAYNEKWGR